LANNKKIIPPNHHKQILPINPLNLYQISQPNQSNNKQNQINLATSNQENFLWPWRVGVAGAKRVVMGFAAGGVQWSWCLVGGSGRWLCGAQRGSQRKRPMEKY
jgi:hypothetical protein